MPMFRISSRTRGRLDVDAANWLSALGDALGHFGVVDQMDRIACEALPNGQILVRDVRNGSGWIVQPLGDEGAVADVAPTLVDEHSFPQDPAPARSPSVGDALAAVVAAPTLAEAARIAVEGAQALVPSEGGSVLLRQPDDTLTFAYANGPGAERLDQARIPAGAGVAGFCVRRGTALALRDAWSDPRFFKQMDAITGVRTRSLLCMPIVRERTAVGCLELVNGRAAAGFDRDAMADAELFADALAKRLATGW